MELRSISATRYVTPLREGGSLPALVEADDDGLYVLKFRGAGQGRKALVAEVVAGELARALGFAVPELARRRARSRDRPRRARRRRSRICCSRARARTSASTSCRARCRSARRPGPAPAPELAADVVWFDALVTNVDRTAEEHEPAPLARPAVADRPRRRALLPPRRRRPPTSTRGGRSRRSPTTCCCRTRARSPRPTSGSRRAVTRELLEDVAAAIPAAWLDGDDSRRLRRLSLCAARGAARLRRGGGARPVCAVARSPTPSSASCRGSSAASGSTPA